MRVSSVALISAGLTYIVNVHRFAQSTNKISIKTALRYQNESEKGGFGKKVNGGQKEKTVLMMEGP